MQDCINPEKFFSYIERVSHEPKFVIIKKQKELAKVLSIISVNLKRLIQKPIKTAITKEIQLKNIVL